MTPVVSIVISGLALAVSVAVAWLTLFRRGNLRMTQPVLIGFLYDLPDGEPKVFFRTLLYTTGKRGHVIEGMYLKVTNRESSQTFDFWAYGETKALMIGSGLRVDEDGLSSNHHFLPPKERSSFQFLPGDYTIEVYARAVNRRHPVLLSRLRVSLPQEHAAALRDKSNGVLFTWSPETRQYHPHVSQAPRSSLPMPFLIENR